MKIYMPPQRRGATNERRGTHQHVRQFLTRNGMEVISRTGGARSLPWLKQAGGLVLETSAVTEADESECLYMANELGRQVLVLYDLRSATRGGQPSAQLVAASRRDGNENANLWLVQHRPTPLDSPVSSYAVVDSALSIYVGSAMGWHLPAIDLGSKPETA